MTLKNRVGGALILRTVLCEYQALSSVVCYSSIVIHPLVLPLMFILLCLRSSAKIECRIEGTQGFMFRVDKVSAH